METGSMKITKIEGTLENASEIVGAVELLGGTDIEIRQIKVGPKFGKWKVEAWFHGVETMPRDVSA